MKRFIQNMIFGISIVSACFAAQYFGDGNYTRAIQNSFLCVGFVTAYTHIFLPIVGRKVV